MTIPQRDHTFATRSRIATGFLLTAFALSACDCDPTNITEVECNFEVDTPDGQDRIEFRSTEVDTERSRTFRINNTGNQTLSAFEFEFSQINSTHYRVTGTDDFRIDPQGDGSLNLIFAPLAESPNLNTTLTISHPPTSGDACPAYNITIEGSSFEGINTADAGPDAGGDGGPNVDVVNQEGGPIDRDGGVVRPPDGGIIVDPTTRFEARGALQQARTEFASVALADGSIIVIGGYGENGQALTSIERFDPEIGLSTHVADMASPRGAPAAAFDETSGKIVIVGGRTEATNGLVNTTLETFDPESDLVDCPGSQGACGLDDIDQGRGVLDGEGRIAPTVSAPSGTADADVIIIFGRELVDDNGTLVERVKAGGVVVDVNTLTVTPLQGVDAVVARRDAALLFNDEGRFALFGGLDVNNSPLSSAVRLELAPLRISSLSPISRPLLTRTHGAATLLDNGDGFLMAGLDAASDTLGSVEKLIQPFGDFESEEMALVLDEGRVSPSMVSLEGNLILLAGGADRDVSDIEVANSIIPRRDAEVFVALPNSIVRLAPDNDLASPRLGHRAHRVTLEDDIEAVVFLGGTSVTPRRRAHPQAERFITSQNKFELYGLMGPGTAFSREAPNALYTLGGIDPHTGSLSPRVRVFDSITDTYSDASPLSEPRRDHSATLLADQNTVLVAGGRDNAGQVLSSLSLYNPFNAFDVPLTVTLTRARARHTTNLLEDGRVLICGGEGAGGEALDTCEVFTPPSDLLDPETYDEALIDVVLGRMSAGRTGHTATLLPDTGEVLLVGGGNVEVDLVTADLFSTETTRLQTTAQPILARRDHGALNIGSGRVLLVGGEIFSGGLGPTAQSEFYDRAFGSFTAIDDELLRARSGLGVVAVGNEAVIVTGGAETGEGDFATRSIRLSEVYDIATNEFRGSNDLALTYSRSDVSLLDVFGRGLVAGGTHRDGRLANGDERQTPLFFVDKLVSTEE